MPTLPHCLIMIFFHENIDHYPIGIGIEFEIIFSNLFFKSIEII